MRARITDSPMNAHINLAVSHSSYPCDATPADIEREDEARRHDILDAIRDEWIQLRAAIDELEGRIN